MSPKSVTASKRRPAKPIPPLVPMHQPAPPSAKRPAAPIRSEAAEPASAGIIAETAIQLIPYPLLARAPENVRHVREAEDVTELADDIAAHGLLQSLIGYQDATQDVFPAGFTWIVGGGRRLAALALLHTRGIINDAYRVPVLVRDMADAIELSLSENLARRDMSPVDEFFAFRDLMRPGTIDAAGLAKRFGLSERYVKQRLRLAELAPEILDALRERQLTIDAAMAYAFSQDHDLQKRVFAVHKRTGAWKPHDPEAIRRDLSVKVIHDTSPIAVYVGATAYEAAGGRYDDDLFANPLSKETRRLADSALVRRLAIDKARHGLVETVSALNAAGAGLTAGALIAPDLEVGHWQWTRPKPPAGFVQIDCQYDKEKRWNAARNCGAQVKGIVGLDLTGKLTLVDTVFFVDKEKAKEVKPPEPAREVYRQPTEEQLEERRRAGLIETWSRRLALGGFDDTKFAKLAFWPPDYDRGSERHVHPDLGDGYLVSVRIFVTSVAAEAHVAAATAKLDAIKAEQAVKKEAEERRQSGLDEAHNAKVAAIAAMDPPPAVVIADDVAWYRHADGFYADAPEGDSEAGGGFDELTQLLAEVDELGRAFATVEDFRAAANAGFDPANPDPYDDELDADEDADERRAAA